MEIRQSKEYAKHLANLGWTVEIYDEINYFVRKMPILRAVLKIQRPENLNFEVIEQLRKKYRPFQTIIEPKNKNQAMALKDRGYCLSKSPYLPTKTLILKLNSKEKIFKNFKKDTRYAIKKSSNLIIAHNPPIADFHASWKSQAHFSQYVPALSTLVSLQTSFGTNMLVLTSHNDINEQKKFSAGSVFLKSGDTAYYWQSFSGTVGRSTLAQYSLVYQGILWAISKGARSFDFEGIYDNRFPNKRWLGFSHFKKQFGGQEVSYPGSFVKYFWSS